VYVVELSDRVGNEARFCGANPDYRLGKPFVYVGMTGLDPALRFDRHKAGIQANRFVLEYGLRLVPALYEVYNPMPCEAAREMEVELAIGLHEAGYAGHGRCRAPRAGAGSAQVGAAQQRPAESRSGRRRIGHGPTRTAP